MSDRSARRDAPAVNAGSMADIAFLLLIFFLVTTTIAEDAGVLVRLPPWDPNAPLEQTSQVLTLIVNANDELLVENERATPTDIPAALRDFVLSPKRQPDQAVVSLVHDRSTSYTKYVEVYDALLLGYHTLWNEVANRRYGENYEELSEADQVAVRKEVPMVISEAEPNDVLKDLVAAEE